MIIVNLAAGRKARNAGSFLRKELPDRAEDRSEYLEDTFVPNQALSGPRPFGERPLSSVAYGATFFQRKKAFSLRHEAQETLI